MKKFLIFAFVAFLSAFSTFANAEITESDQKLIDTLKVEISDEATWTFATSLYLKNDETLIAFFTETRADTQLAAVKFVVEELDKTVFGSGKKAKHIAKLAKRYAPKEVGKILEGLPPLVFDHFTKIESIEFCEDRWETHTSPSFWGKKVIPGVKDEDSFEKSKPFLVKFWDKETAVLEKNGCQHELQILAYRLNPDLHQWEESLP